MSRLRWCIKLSLIFLTLASCKQTQKKAEPGAAPEIPFKILSGETELVSLGNSSQAVYSPDGSRLLYVSGERKAHRQSQVYELNLEKKSERRITFQDGFTYGPRYHPKEPFIVYASSTDEMKENSPLLHPPSAAKKIPPPPFGLQLEIYLHSLNGLDISRLSDHPGFDGLPRFSVDGQSVSWTRMGTKGPETVLYNRRTHAVTRPVPGLAPSSDWQAAPDGKSRAWLEWETDLEKSWLVVQKGKAKGVRPVSITASAPRHSLTFSPDGKWLLWQESGDLWTADTETLCARVLLKTADRSERDPTISPDMKWLTYTAVQGERSRILRMAFTPPAGSCPAAP
jgi:Tol biopolymer transport system component